MGKQHENISFYEKFAEDLMDYVSINLKYGGNLRELIEDMSEDQESAIGKEPELTANNEIKYKIMYSRFLDRANTYEENKKKVYTLIIEQYTPGLTTTIGGTDPVEREIHY